jgi:hypothetical protein
MNSTRRRRLALIEQKTTTVDPPRVIVVHFPGCRPTRAEAINGRVWHREGAEGDEDFERRVKADLPERSAVPSVVIFFGEQFARRDVQYPRQ